MTNFKYKLNGTHDEHFKDDYTCQIDNNFIIDDGKITTRKYFPINEHKNYNNKYMVELSDLPNCFCTTEVGLMVPNQYIRDLDKIKFDIEIGGNRIDGNNNLLVFMMLNPKMKFENGSYYISLTHNILDNNNPLFWMGCFRNVIRIFFTFGDSMDKELINQYIVYVDYRIKESSCTDHNVKMYDDVKSPLIKKKIFQNQYTDESSHAINKTKNFQKYKLTFNFPTHYFYLYWDDYLDHLKNITFYFNNTEINTVDVSKLKLNNNDFFEAINNDSLSYQNTIKQNLNLLPKSIVEFVLMPYLYNTHETFDTNKVIYVIKIDPNFDPNNYNFKTQTINLSRIDSQIICVETDQIDINTMFHIGCLSSNILQQFRLGVTYPYFNN